MIDNEPSMDKIDDYNGNESKSKRRTINLIIAGLLLIGLVLGVYKVMNTPSNENYVGTQENPGINTTKKGY